MAHVYATVSDLKASLVDGGYTGTTNDALMLTTLTSVSRRIDSACHRSRFGSGFGPRIGVNLYDGDGSNELLLHDDLQSVSAFTVAPFTSGTGASPVVTTDYFLGSPGGYTGIPYRKVILHGRGTPIYYGSGYRTISVSGTWGYPTDLITNSTTVASGLSASTTAQTFTTSASPTIYPGNTIRVGSEDLFVVSVAATTATVLRGQNGTTAAVHADASAITTHVYDARVVDVCLRLAVRRWRSRDAGADGSDAGLGMASSTPREGEETIIRRGMGDLMLLGQY